MRDVYNLSKFQHIEILKIDIEGSEYEILTKKNINFLEKNTSQILIEFHDFIDKKKKEKTNKIIKYLSKNFLIIKFTFF